jgi:hypothetical protein
MREINGIAINQPIDGWNHFWDMVRYGHIAFNSQSKILQTSEEVLKSINY